MSIADLVAGTRRGIFASRSLLILAACILPLGLLIVGLALDQFGRQRTALLAEMAALTREQHHVVEQTLAEADRQLGRMRLAFLDALDPATGDGAMSGLVAGHADLPHARIDGVEWSPGGMPSAHGNLIGVPDLATSPHPGPVAAALAMLDAVDLEARLGTRSHWSYFFSAQGDFITIHPYVSLADIAGSAARPVGSVAELIAHWLGYEVYLLGTPARNPDRLAYWTPVYDDAGGAGPMVSHATPIHDGNRFLGIIGTDVLLTTFQDMLSHMRQPVGYVAILNRQGEVLGIDGVSFDGDTGLMRAHLAAADRAGLPETMAFHRQGGDWVLMRPTRAGTGFHLLHVIPDAELRSHLLPRFVGYGWILLGLAVMPVLLLFMLHRWYIDPGFALAGWLYGEAAGHNPPTPRLPQFWQPMLARIAAAFADARIWQDQLRRSEARFHAATSNLPQGFAIADPDGRIAFHNAAFRRLLQPDDSQAGLSVGCPLADVHGLAALSESPTLLHGRWLRRQIVPMSDGGRVIILRDVTQEHEAELKLRESEARYRTVVNTQTEFVVRYTPEGRPLFANAAYCRYMDVEPEALGTRDDSDFTYILPEDRAAHDAHIAALRPERPTSTITFRSILPDGSFHWEEWNDTAIFDADGRLVEIQAVGRDITERKRAEEALRQTEKMAALGSLLAGVAHELNNPLAIVVGYAGMLQEMAPDTATRRRAQEIHGAADRCARIVRSFLAMARSRPVERVALDLRAVIVDAVELAAYGLRSNGIEVKQDLPADLPPVLADRDQMHQVFMNLVLNAQQAMMAVEGPRRLTIRAARAGPAVVVTCADTGHGIDAASHPRLFEPFFTTKPQGMGTGIGLSVCLRIIEAHGGSIRLDPAPGGGAVARVELPAIDGIGPDRATAPAIAAAAGLAGRRILAVDDEPAILGWVAEALAAEGAEVVACSDGGQALELLRTDAFDAVLTDLRMPGTGGDRLLAFIASERPDLLSRVIVMTGDALGAETALLPGLDRILEKPLDPAALRTALAHVLHPGPGPERRLR